MANKKAASGNKSQAIREALAANPHKGPTVIAEILKRQGYDVSPTYVSVVKSAGKAKTGRKVKRRVVVRRAGGEVGNGAPLVLAAQFIREAGGLAEAKEVLRTLEEIGRVL